MHDDLMKMKITYLLDKANDVLRGDDGGLWGWPHEQTSVTLTHMGSMIPQVTHDLLGSLYGKVGNPP